MMNLGIALSHRFAAIAGSDKESGFTLTEFLISALILLVISAAVFGMLSDIQRVASYQTEVQSVLNNSRIAMQTLERYIRQAGNDPLGCGLTGISIVSSTEVGIQSDLTGSAGVVNPDKGDPDGDINDSGENVTIRFNRTARTLEVVPAGSSAQIVAAYISGLSLQYYDAGGNTTADGSEVRKISITISSASLLPDPQTHRVFAIQLNSDIQVST
jgi:type II secretory pathway component PulJ